MNGLETNFGKGVVDVTRKDQRMTGERVQMVWKEKREVDKYILSIKKIRWSVLKWFGHVERLEEDRMDRSVS